LGLCTCKGHLQRSPEIKVSTASELFSTTYRPRSCKSSDQPTPTEVVFHIHPESLNDTSVRDFPGQDRTGFATVANSRFTFMLMQNYLKDRLTTTGSSVDRITAVHVVRVLGPNPSIAHYGETLL
jgi:hypothetical protein